MPDARNLFWITPAIAQGGYPLDEDFPWLLESGVTHLLNLDLPYMTVPAQGLSGFAGILVHTFPDGVMLSEQKACAILDALHAVLIQPDAKVYVHCSAGISRSPTIVWLYLVACGKDPIETAQWIVAGAPSAIPGNPALVNAALLEKVVEHARTRYFPHPRPEVLEGLVNGS